MNKENRPMQRHGRMNTTLQRALKSLHTISLAMHIVWSPYEGVVAQTILACPCGLFRILVALIMNRSTQNFRSYNACQREHEHKLNVSQWLSMALTVTSFANTIDSTIFPARTTSLSQWHTIVPHHLHLTRISISTRGCVQTLETERTCSL